MRRIASLDELPELSGSVVTDGMFDGVHLGHQQILKRLVAEARSRHLPSVVLSYWPHPRLVLQPDGPPLRLLTTVDEKAAVFEKLGLDYMVVLPFDREFSSWSPIRFVSEILVKGLTVQKLWVGYDHRFGKERQGDVHFLRSEGKKQGFEVEEVGRQEVEEIAISSTRIRQALADFGVEKANQFLGRPYSLSGVVRKGDQRGRLIGFPTANLEISEPSKLIPADGVYVTRVHIGQGVWSAMTNIGVRPTVDGKTHTIETHLLDFDGDLYGSNLEIEFMATLRREKKFSGLEELKKQLGEDRMQSRSWFARGEQR